MAESKQFSFETITIETLVALHDDLNAEMAKATAKQPDLVNELMGGAPWMHPEDRVYYSELMKACKTVLRHYIAEHEWSKYEI